ncbi:MAG: hypothetical protein U0528_05920 [Anaerolineae bacterium]
MTLKVKRCLICLCALLLLLNFSATGIVTAARAQVAPPLLMLKDGDLYSWSVEGKALTRLTEYGFHRRPVLSPDGRTVAFNSWTQAAVDAIRSQRFSAEDGDFPSDIILLDILTRQQQTIAGQPADISLAGSVKSAVSRSNPTWSPDGQALAWTEVLWSADGTEISYQLAVYHLASAQTTYAPLPAPILKKDEGVRTIRAMWGSGGIAMYIPRKNPNTPGALRELYIFNADATPKQIITLEDSYYDFMWVRDGAKDYIGVLYFSKPWTLIDPETTQTSPMNGTPEMYEPGSDRYSIFVTAKMNGAQVAGLQWSAASAVAQKVEPLKFQAETNFAHRITVSPQGIAYVLDAVYVWQDGNLTKIDGTADIARGWTDGEAGAIVWGATAWRVRH